HVRPHLDADRPADRLGHGAGGDPCGRLAGTGALQHVAHVLVPVLEDAREVGVPGPGQPDRLAPPAVLLELLRGHRPRAHRVRPVRVIAVLDEERYGAAQRAAVADAAERPHVVLLELLARAAAVARLAARQVAADQLVVELDARRHAADDDRQAWPVRFAGG